MEKKSATQLNSAGGDAQSLRQKCRTERGRMNGNGRLRVRKACVTCKQRKVKCDGQYPCSKCAKHGQRCEYDYSSSKRRSKYRKRGSSEGSQEDAESRILGGADGRMAKLLLQLGNQVDRRGKWNGGEGSYSGDEIGSGRGGLLTLESGANVSSGSDCHGHRRRCPWQCFSFDKYRFHRRYQNVLPHYLGKSLLCELSPQTVKTYKLKQPRIQNYGWNLSGGHYLKHDERGGRGRSGDNGSGGDRGDSGSADGSKLFDFENKRDVAIVEKLLQFFFKEINPVLSIVHEQMFWQQFRNGFLNQNKRKNSSAKLFLSILYLILAISMRFYEGRLADNVGIMEGGFFDAQEEKYLEESVQEESMFKYAYSIVTKLTFEWESFELIQSWLLISFYFRTCYRQTACWNALNQAVGMCNGMSLYLNRFPEKHSKYDENRAWHCYWACFIMDKLITFQMGRFYLLPLPVQEMTRPGEWRRDNRSEKRNVDDEEGSEGISNDDYFDDWFHDETVQLFHLSLIVMACQKKNGEELTVEESLKVRDSLNSWCKKFVVKTKINETWTELHEIQPLLTYLDVRLTFETKGLFLLINRPSEGAETVFPTDLNSQINHCELSVNVMNQIFDKKLIFIPWWLNLSQLFTASVVCITLIHSGLQAERARIYLFQCMHILNGLESMKPKNSPQMLPECLWCLRMLNYMCCIRLISSATQLEMLVGIDPGDSSSNENRFAQFGRVGERGEVDEEVVDDNDDLEVSASTGNNIYSKFNTAVSSTTQQVNPFTQTLENPSIGGQVNVPQPQLDNFPIQQHGQIPPKISNLVHSGFAPEHTANNGFESDGDDLFDEGLFSYLQWFDQSFV